MNESVEIRHSPQEITRQLLVCAVMLIGFIVLEVTFRDTSTNLLPFNIAVALVLLGLAWISLSHEYVRVDDTGVATRRWLVAREVLWSQVASFSADWQMGYDDFLFSSYGRHNLQGKIVLKDKAGRKLITLKVDMGTREHRSQFRTFIMLRLQKIMTRPTVSEPITAPDRLQSARSSLPSSGG